MITILERRATRRAQVSQLVNVSWAFTGNLVYALSQLAILICLSRYVSAEIVGYYAFAAACTNPIIAFFNLQLRSYQATDARSEYDFNTYFTLRIFMMGFGAIVALFVCSFIGADPLLASIVLLLMLRKALDSVSDVLYGFFQQRGRMDCIAKSLMATGVASFVGLAIAVMRTGNLETGLTVSAAVTAAILLGYTVPACLRLRRDRLMTAPPTARALTSLTRATAPLGAATLLLSLAESIPTYIVGHTLGARQLGIFAVFWYATTIGSTVMTAIGQSLSRQFGLYERDGNRTAFRRMLMWASCISLAVALLGAAAAETFGRPILSLVYSDTYARETDILAALLLGAGFGYVGVILGFGLVAARKARAQLVVIALVAIVTTLVGWVLIPEFGLFGAAITIGSAGIVQVAVSGGILWHHTREPRIGRLRRDEVLDSPAAPTAVRSGAPAFTIKITLVCLATGALIGVASPMLLLFVEGLGRNIPKTGLIPDYAFALVWASLLGLSIVCFPVSSAHKLALAMLWVCRMGTTLGFMLLVEAWYPGADAYDYYVWANDSRYGWDGFTLGDGNGTVTTLVWLQDQVFPDSFHALKVSWSFVGLIATYIFYRAICLALGREDRRILFLMGAAPSILYWSSILGKDPISLLGMAIYAYGVIAWYQRNSLRYLALVVLGIIIVVYIRSWYGPVMVLPLLAFVFGRTSRNTIHSWWVRGVSLAVLATGFVVFWTQSTFADSFSSTETFLKTTSTINQSFANGGSATEAVPVTSLGSLLMHLPVGILSALFRPLPGELLTPFGLIAGFENLIFLLWIGLILVTFNRHHYKDPVVLWLLGFTVLWAAQYGLTASTNLGSLVRYRLQVLPILLGLLILLSAAPRFGPADAESLATALRRRLPRLDFRRTSFPASAVEPGPPPPISKGTS